MDTVAADIARIEAALADVVAELEAKEAELDVAEAAYREAEDHRRRIEEIRRLAGEEAAGRRAEAEAIQRAMVSAEREHERVAQELAGVRERIAAAEAARGDIESDIEQMDGQTAPLAERRNQLDDERRKLVDRIEELTEARRRMQARKDLLDARRRDIEETPGSRFLAGHTGGAIGLLKDLVRVEPGLERALVAALGALADAVVYDDGDRALADAPQGDGAILAIAAGGPVPLGLPGEQKLLSKVEAEPAARGIVSTVLRDVYLVGDIAEAARKQTAHPQASFVTPEGVLVGPAVIHTAKEADVRLREIRAELQVLAHDLSATEQQLRPRTERLDRDRRRGRVPAGADRGGRRRHHRGRGAAHDRRARAGGDAQGGGAARPAARRRWSRRPRPRASASPRWAPGATEEIPELPPLPQAPIHARVTVETLRRDRASQDHRLAELREERDQLAAHDPVLLREELAAAEAARAEAEAAVGAADAAFAAATEARAAAGTAEREAAEAEAAVNKSWRDASTALEELRQPLRGRGPSARRHRAAHRRGRALAARGLPGRPGRGRGAR